MAKFTLTFRGDVCKGCELCREACPRDVIEMSGTLNSKGYAPACAPYAEKCVGCLSCALICPDGVIEIFKEEDGEK